MLEIFNFFSTNISQILKKELIDKPLNELEEIRIRSNGYITVKLNNSQEVLKERITYQEILETLQIMCNNSIYSYQNEIKNGYITVKGGHRVGIAGDCVIENGKVTNIRYISSINFRVAREIIGCSNIALQYILNTRENTIYNTLIISPPGVRKDYTSKGYCKKHKYRYRWNWV